jgi:hypothetical protein
MSPKAWREVIAPHQDVLEGTFQEAAFAADLTQVVLGIAPPDYQDPVRFFERTLITEGMSLLLQSVLKRLSGKGGDPVVQLQTAFGGGKTHTMMAVLHVARATAPAKAMHGVPELLAKAKVKELVKATVAVLDGNALSPSEPRKHGKISARTLWGELAWQLGGEAGYAKVASSDRDGTSPGKDVLAGLLEACGPCAILMDETVAYLRQLEPGKSYAGGTYNANLSFLQALTEAAARVPNAMVLASLPESKLEVGDGTGVQALEAVQKLFGRIEAVWKPVGSEESFEIVRRRLFGAVQDEAARDQACSAFSAMYAAEPDKFPAEARDAGYLRRMKASYPIHPEVFERLYEDWSSLPNFQRTRGVLRLMARLVHSLWREDNRDALILPGSIPLGDLNVRNEMVKHLPAGWDPVVDKDIDGNNAVPRRIDDDTPALGSMQACRRAARTIFLGSAPSVGTQKVRGIGVERVRLGCAQPGQSIGKIDDALRRLSEQLHYLYLGNDRFWFDLRTNLRREMEDRVERFDDRLHVAPEIEARLRKLVKVGVFANVHVALASKDIPDKADLRLVVLDVDHGHKRGNLQSRAVQEAEAILASHGEKPREFQNRLLFLAPESVAAGTLRTQVRRMLAWASIVEGADELNLDKHHEKESKKSLEEAGRSVDGCIRETFRTLLVPFQEASPEGGVGAIEWEEATLELASGGYEKAIEAVCREREWIIGAWAPAHLAALLTRWFWKADRPIVSLSKVWNDMGRYLYFPRLSNSDVFLKTVRDGIEHVEYFGYAGSRRDDGELEGLVLGGKATVYLPEPSLLVRPAEAEEAKARAEAKRTPRRATPSGGIPKPAVGSDAPPASTKSPGARSAPPTQAMARRFHGTKTIEDNDMIGSFTAVVENVIEHFLAQYGTKVTVTIDIEAKRAEGFDLKTVRIVRENAKTMHFKTSDFEEE